MAQEPIAEAPALPPTSLDFNAFHDALAEGKTGKEAIAIADLAPTAPVDQADNSVTHPDETGEIYVASLPSLTSKTKAELLTIAEDETVDLGDATTNADIITAIEAKRNAPLSPPEAPTGEDDAA